MQTNKQIGVPLKKLAYGGFGDDNDPYVTEGKPQASPNFDIIQTYNTNRLIQPSAVTNGPGITGIVPGTGQKGINWGMLASSAGKYADALAPYASNIVNAFRRPPKQMAPILDNTVTLNRPSFDNARNKVEAMTFAADTGADRTLTPQQAAAVKASNLGQRLSAFSNLSEAENNANSQISNQQAMINAGVQSRNNAALNEYNQGQTEQAIANQREQSANFANAGDKYVAIKNELSKAHTEQEKAKVLMMAYSNSGVGKRERAQMKAMGIKDPLGLNYSDIEDEPTYTKPAPANGIVRLKKLGGNMRKIC